MRITRLLMALLVMFVIVAGAQLPVNAQASQPDLSGIKTYLLEKATALTEGVDLLKADADALYDLAKAANFDYDALWKDKAAELTEIVKSAKEHWLLSSPLYEQMEGIVAGVPILAPYDVIIDAGAKGEVDYTITLPDGKILEKPGNLFGLLELALWGGDPEQVYVAKQADLDGNGTIEFGDVLPDANALKGFADNMVKYTDGLLTDAKAWEPSLSDAFTALVVMIPTMSEYFESWKLSRFVAGNESQLGEFSVISRLSDIKDIIASLDVIYGGISPVVKGADAARDQQISSGLSSLKDYVTDLYEQEQGGTRFTAEEADLFGSEAQDKAEAIAGQVSQVAALLNVQIAQ
jgi:hypothetical protein